MSLKVAKADLVKLFLELGVKDPSKWNKEKMTTKIGQLSGLPKEDKETETEESKKLLEKLVEAVDDKDTIELEGYDDVPAAEKKEDGKKEEKKTEDAKAEGKKKGGKKKAAAEGDGEKKDEKKEPGVIGSIVEFLKGATEEKPLSKEAIADKLEKRFPDRKRDSMIKTVNVQVPNRIKVDKKLDVKKNDKGYWIPG